MASSCSKLCIFTPCVHPTVKSHMFMEFGAYVDRGIHIFYSVNSPSMYQHLIHIDVFSRTS